MNPKVKEFINKSKKWKAEISELRQILLDCELTEGFKWRTPCYMHNDKNIVVIGSLKDACILSFFKGVLLKDEDKILQQQGENAQTFRIVTFQNVEEIRNLERLLKKYIAEAIEIEKAGLKIEYKKVSEFEIPEELEQKFEENAEFKTAFEALTAGRQKGYLLHFAAAKQAKTRSARIEKYLPRIFEGKGMNDCTCGLSKRMPGCDGSHRDLIVKK